MQKFELIKQAIRQSVIDFAKLYSLDRIPSSAFLIKNNEVTAIDLEFEDTKQKDFYYNEYLPYAIKQYNPDAMIIVFPASYWTEDQSPQEAKDGILIFYVTKNDMEVIFIDENLNEHNISKDEIEPIILRTALNTFRELNRDVV